MGELIPVPVIICSGKACPARKAELSLRLRCQESESRLREMERAWEAMGLA